MVFSGASAEAPRWATIIVPDESKGRRQIAGRRKE